MRPEFDKKLIGDVVKIILLAAFFSSMAFLLEQPDTRKFLLDVDNILIRLRGGGDTTGYIFSSLIFILVSGMLISLGIPRIWASAVGGGIYGVFMGSILSIIASLIGASILYLAGKTILTGIVERRAGDKLGIWKVRFQENTFWWVLYGRFFPFSNSTVMSLLSGSCNVHFTPYILGSLVGFVPLAVVFATCGSGSVKGNMWQIGLATMLLILAIFSRSLVKRWFYTKKMYRNT